MLKIPVGFDYRTFTELGETETLGGHKENLLRARAQGKGAVTPQVTEPHLPVNVWKSPVEVWVDSGLPWRQGTCSTVLGGACWPKSPWRPPLALLQCQDWVVSGQTTNREGAQPHPSADSWSKGLLSMAECGPLEKGMANHFSILALRTPWTVWKGKMIGFWKRNSPGQ